jgi:hypothetical protein
MAGARRAAPRRDLREPVQMQSRPAAWALKLTMTMTGLTVLMTFALGGALWVAFQMLRGTAHVTRVIFDALAAWGD